MPAADEAETPHQHTQEYAGSPTFPAYPLQTRLTNSGVKPEQMQEPILKSLKTQRLSDPSVILLLQFLVCSAPCPAGSLTIPCLLFFLPGQALSCTATPCVTHSCFLQPCSLLVHPEQCDNINSFFSCSLNMVEHILTPAVGVVLFLLAVAAGVLVILSRKKKKGE